MRILLLSDIHANLEALEACLAAAPAHDVVMNLGDVVGYGASPNEVIAQSRTLGQLFVRGNHDKAVCGLMDTLDFNPIASAAVEWTRNQLTPENLDWLRSLPHGPVTMEGVEGVQFVHGSPADEDEYVVSPPEAMRLLEESAVSLSPFSAIHICKAVSSPPSIPRANKVKASTRITKLSAKPKPSSFPFGASFVTWSIPAPSVSHGMAIGAPPLPFTTPRPAS